MNENLIKFDNELPIINSDTFIAKNAMIIGKVTIGSDCSIWYNTVLRGDVNDIIIGDRVNVQDGCVMHVDSKNSIIVENDVTIGHMVLLHACHIQKYTLIGMGSTILDGAIIGEESIVGANSLVTKEKKFPPRSLIMGSPAKFIRKLTEEEVTSLKKSADSYVKLKDIYLDE